MITKSVDLDPFLFWDYRPLLSLHDILCTQANRGRFHPPKGRRHRSGDLSLTVSELNIDEMRKMQVSKSK
jgi:hypothetical protein